MTDEFIKKEVDRVFGIADEMIEANRAADAAIVAATAEPIGADDIEADAEPDVTFESLLGNLAREARRAVEAQAPAIEAEFADLTDDQRARLIRFCADLAGGLIATVAPVLIGASAEGAAQTSAALAVAEAAPGLLERGRAEGRAELVEGATEILQREIGAAFDTGFGQGRALGHVEGRAEIEAALCAAPSDTVN